MFRYHAYGISFESAIELPDIVQAADAQSSADVTIRIGTVPEHLDGQHDDHGYFQTGRNRTLLKFDGVARYLISSGARITVEPFPDTCPDMIRLYLLGSASGALLYQRGLFPLHGSAIETATGAAMVFVGPQGIGKSTLAAHFRRRGYRTLSDDICVIAPDETGALHVVPAFSKLRLRPDAVERLGQSTADLQQARFDGDKFVIPTALSHCPHPVPLGAIHLLSLNTGTNTIVTPYSGFDRVDLLLSNLYRSEYLRGLESEERIYSLALSISKQAPVVEVAHNRDPERIEALLDRLEREWNLR